MKKSGFSEQQIAFIFRWYDCGGGLPEGRHIDPDLLPMAPLYCGRPHFGIDWTVSMPDHFPNLGPIVPLTDWRGRASGPSIDSLSGV